MEIVGLGLLGVICVALGLLSTRIKSPLALTAFIPVSCVILYLAIVGAAKITGGDVPTPQNPSPYTLPQATTLPPPPKFPPGFRPPPPP